MILLYPNAGSASTTQLLRVASELVAALSPSAPVGVPGGHVARDVLTALIALEGFAQSRGLVMKALLEQVDVVIRWLEPAALQSHVLPFAMRVIASNSWQSHKRAAARLALCCLRRLRTTAQRTEVCAWAVSLATHPSFQMRLLFLDILRQLISAAPPAGCSRQFLKVRGCGRPRFRIWASLPCRAFEHNLRVPLPHTADLESTRSHAPASQAR